MHKIAPIAVGICLSAGVAAAQQLRFDDVVRNLRNPDPKVAAERGAAAARREVSRGDRADRGAGPRSVDEIQLEAIAAELSFFLEQDVQSKRMVGFVVEKRTLGDRAQRLRSRAATRSGRAPVPPELVTALLQAVDDENAEGAARGDLRDRRDRAAAAGRRPGRRG